MRFLTTEELNSQYRRVHPAGRLPGAGMDRSALGETGAGRVPSGCCRECGELILGRPGDAITCLVHRAYLGAPGRDELVRLIDEYEKLVRPLQDALSCMDEGAGHEDA